MNSVIKNCRIIGNQTISEPTDIIIENGVISDIGNFGSINGYDVDGKYVSAGFIDIHTHGGNCSDFMDATDEAFDNILKFHLKNGTTAVLATSLTSPVDLIKRFLSETRRYMSKPPKYARVLGAHLEGPFLSLKNCGAQNPKYLLDPKRDDYSFILDNSDIVKTVTIAPERDEDGAMTRALTNAGITVAGGHDDGAYPEFMPAVNSGLRHLTHIYCAMSGLGTKEGVRQIGLREYGLWNDGLTCEMIADNVHIPPEMAKFILKCKGADKTVCVSDSLRCAGMPDDGRIYTLGNDGDETSLKVKISNGIAVLADGSKFAGSITSVREMVKNLINAGVPITEAFKTGTSAPAAVIGESRRGYVKKGYIADLCVLDEDFNVSAVYVGGKKFEREDLL